MKKSTSKFTDSDKLSILREYYASGSTLYAIAKKYAVGWK